MIWRYDVERGDLIGVTIIDFATYWGQRRPELADQIASRLAMSRKEAQAVLDSVDQKLN